MDSIVIGIVGTIWALLWLILYVKSGKKYQTEIDSLNGNGYFMKEMYGIGYLLMDIVHVDMNTPYFHKKMSKVGELYGKKTARSLIRADLAAQITYIATFLPLGILMAVIADEPLILLVIAILAIFLAFYIEYDKSSRIEKRRQEILRDFPHILSQMALLINAGMPLRETLEMTAKKEGGVLQEQLRILTDDMRNGIPEYEALQEFADRCGVAEVRKLSSLIIQNVRKGSSELAAALLELSGEVWRNRTSQVREEG